MSGLAWWRMRHHDPAEHARLACFARVGGLPPPAAVRRSASLRAHSRGDPPHEGPSGDGQLVDFRTLLAAKCITTASRWRAD